MIWLWAVVGLLFFWNLIQHIHLGALSGIIRIQDQKIERLRLMVVHEVVRSTEGWKSMGSTFREAK